jgi:DNA processing protein
MDAHSRPILPEDLIGPLNDTERVNAPPRLYIEGALLLPLRHPRVAIVGTRKPSEDGRKAAFEIASELTKEGVIIVSGLAEGIDTIAHTTAIESGGVTVAVLGTPLSIVFPRKNLELQHRIMRDHLAVSQFPEGRPVSPKDFVSRNRTMALIADASIIIESGENGGSLHQGWEAIRLGRPLFIRSATLNDPSLKWPKSLARYGATELESVRDVLDYVPSARVDRSLDAIT